MMLANDLKTYYDEVRRYLDCPKDEQDRLLLSVNKQVIELQVDNPIMRLDAVPLILRYLWTHERTSSL